MSYNQLIRRVLLSVLCTLSSLFVNAARISLCIKGQMDKQMPVLCLPGGVEQSFTMDSEGKGQLEVNISQPTYVVLSYHYSERPLFLFPNTDIQIAFESDEYRDSIIIKGIGSEVNNYLNGGQLQSVTINDAELDERTYLDKIDSLLKKNVSELKQKGFPKEFEKIEEDRLTYFTSTALPSYPYFHRRIANDPTYQPSSEYWKKMESLVAMDPSLLGLKEYREFISEAVPRMARRHNPDLKYPTNVITYMESEINDPSIKEYLVYEFIYSYVKKNGLDKYYDHLNQVFYDNVQTPIMIKRYKELCSTWDNISVGSQSPDFSSTDISGEKFSLSDFRGKYVYIDVWATWCGPCHREIPYLKALQERYAGKDIYIVSISCDTDRTAWESKVREGLSGIQLHFEENDTFMERYMISGVPRFILLDREGKIILSDMSRPSDPRTVDLLDSLLNVVDNE